MKAGKSSELHVRHRCRAKEIGGISLDFVVCQCLVTYFKRKTITAHIVKVAQLPTALSSVRTALNFIFPL
jgi:hypothetical protein